MNQNEQSHEKEEVPLNMDLTTKPLTSLLVKMFTRTAVNAKGQFHLGIVSQSGVAVLTRTNSVTARRVRVLSFTDLKTATAGKPVNLRNNQSVEVTIAYNQWIFGTPSIKITWFQKCRRYETDLQVQNIGLF